MVKTKGPALSAQALGSLADTITFSKSKGRSYLKYNAKPKDPRTPTQTGRRVWFKGLANAWKILASGLKDTWLNAPNPKNVSLYNVYMQINLDRIDRGEWPSAAYPWTGGGSVGGFAPLDVTEGPRHVRIKVTQTGIQQNWLFVLYRGPPYGGASELENTIWVITRRTTATFTYIDAPLPAGGYGYKFRAISLQGNQVLWPGSWNGWPT